MSVRLVEEEHARALARELAGIDGVNVRRDDGAWEVTVGDGNGERFVLIVLDAVRRALIGQPTVSARVRLDGREYQLQGE